MVDHQRLASVLVEFSSVLVTEYDVDEMLAQVCERSAEILPVHGAGVMLEDEAGTLRFVAASDDTVRKIEVLQVEFGEGPCLQAYRTGESIVVEDFEDSDAFPRFRHKALAVGLRAVASFPMRVPGQCIGALNLYRSEPTHFDEADRTAAQALTDVATAYIFNARAQMESARVTAQLQQALDSRVVIEQAKGRIAEQGHIPVDEAFTRLRRYARDRGQKLHVVARAVVEGRLRVEHLRRPRD